jgi:uncharacterized membrane protein
MTRRWIAPLGVLVMWAFAFAVMPALPERIPTHWNLRGEVDGWMDRPWGALAGPLAATAVVALFAVLPRIDPRRRNFEKFRGELHLMVNLFVLFFLAVEVLTLGAALGWPVDVGQGVLAGIGLLFVAMGNYLPRIRSNWWMGIRTPWTLESETVWRETHRLGGRCFVAGGAAAVAAAFLPEPARGVVATAALLAAGLVPAAWSYVIWRRERGGRAA